MLSYEKKGISLWLNGCPSSPKDISQACQIAEEGFYMRDYVTDEKGEIEKLEFNYIDINKIE